MRKTTGLILGLMLAVATTAHAETSKEAIEAAQKALPQTRVDEVRESPIQGLYEVTADRNILYLSGDRKYLLIGEIYDLKTGKNMTSDRRMEVSKLDWNNLPLDLAIRFGQSDKKKLALFIDPDCPYCVKAYDAIKDLKGVESYVFLYPLPSHKDAKEKCELVMRGGQEGRVGQSDAQRTNQRDTHEPGLCGKAQPDRSSRRQPPPGGNSDLHILSYGADDTGLCPA